MKVLIKFSENMHISLRNAKINKKVRKVRKGGKIAKSESSDTLCGFCFKNPMGKLMFWESFSPKVNFWVKSAKFSENDERK